LAHYPKVLGILSATHHLPSELDVSFKVLSAILLPLPRAIFPLENRISIILAREKNSYQLSEGRQRINYIIMGKRRRNQGPSEDQFGDVGGGQDREEHFTGNGRGGGSAGGGSGKTRFATPFPPFNKTKHS